MPTHDPILAASNYHRAAMFLEKTRYFARELETVIERTRANPALANTLQREVRNRADRAHARADSAGSAARYARLRAGEAPELAHFAEGAEQSAAAALEVAERAETMAQAFFDELPEERVAVEE